MGLRGEMAKVIVVSAGQEQVRVCEGGRGRRERHSCGVMRHGHGVHPPVEWVELGCGEPTVMNVKSARIVVRLIG